MVSWWCGSKTGGDYFLDFGLLVPSRARVSDLVVFLPSSMCSVVRSLRSSGLSVGSLTCRALYVDPMGFSFNDLRI